MRRCGRRYFQLTRIWFLSLLVCCLNCLNLTAYDLLVCWLESDGIVRHSNYECRTIYFRWTYFSNRVSIIISHSNDYEKILQENHSYLVVAVLDMFYVFLRVKLTYIVCSIRCSVLQYSCTIYIQLYKCDATDIKHYALRFIIII